MSVQPTTWGLDPVQQQHLAGAVAWHVSHGWRVESAPMPGQVVVVSGRPTNHVLHLLLTLVTMGLWGIIWLAMAMGPSSESRAVLTVQPDGSVSNSLRPLPHPEGATAKVPWYRQTWPIVLMVVGAMALVVALAAAGSGS